MDRFGSRRFRRLSSFESGAIEPGLSSKHSRPRSTQQAVRAWVEQLEIRQLLAADLSVAITGRSATPTYFLDKSMAKSVVTQSASIGSVGADPDLSSNSASQKVTASKESDLVPTITGPTVAAAGTLVDYVLSVSNTGELPAGKDMVTFNIPANAPLVSMGSSTFSITPEVAPGTTGPVTFEINPGLKPGQVATVSFLERIDPSVPDGSTIVPTATLVRMTGVDHPSANSTSLTTKVIAQADVSAAMTGPTDITAGGNATYTITLTNKGPSDAQNVNFLDDLPAGMLFKSISQTSGAPFSFVTPASGAAGTASGTGTLPAGTSAVFQLVGTLKSSVPAAPNGMTNTVNVSTTTAGDDPGNDTATVASNVVTTADLAVSIIEPTSITAGTAAFYRIVVQNNGLSDATSVVIETVLPPSETYDSSMTNYSHGTVSVIGSGPSGQTIIFTVPDLPAGASDVIDVASTINSQAPAMPISNNASATSATPDPDLTNNSASVSVPVATAADLRVGIINESTPPPMLAGDTGKLEVQVTNGGPSNAQNLVVTDTLPIGASLVSITDQSGSATNLPVAGATGTVSWTIPAIAPRVSEGFDLVYQLGPASEVATKSDSATVSSSTSDPNALNNSATLPLDLWPAAVMVNGPAVSRAGTPAQYSFTFFSGGWSLATIDVPQGATISATNGYGLPSGLVGRNGIFSFPIFKGAEFELSETTPSSTPDGTILTNSAWVNFDTSTTQSASTKIIAQADIAASVTGPSEIVPGTLASYTLKVTNNGPSDAHNVTFDDALPPGVSFQSLEQTSGWAFEFYPPLGRTGGRPSGYSPYFPAGASASFTLTLFVPSDLSADSLTDTFNVATTTTDLNSANNSASVTTPVHPQADLGVALSTVGRAVAGTGFTYTISLSKTGPSVAKNVVVSEVLAPGVVFSSFGSSSTSGPYTASGPDVGTNGTVTFQIPSVLPYGFYSFTVNVALPSNTPAGPLPSTATVTSSTPDPNTSNNTATDTITQVTTSADVKITDTPPMMFIDYSTPNFPPVLHPVFVLKQNNTWVVDVTNSGPSDAQNVTWSSAIPTGVMVESVSQVSGPTFTLTTPTGGTGTISGNIATLPAGQSAEFDLVFAQDGVAAGDTVSDTAIVTSDTADPDKYNNTSTAAAQAYTPGDLAASIQNPSTASAGTYVNYIIDITNNGQLSAGGATLNFDIPAGERLSSITTSSGFPTLPDIPYGTTGPINFTLPAGMISGGDANITLQLYIDPDVPNATVLAPTATLTDTPPSDDPSNNTASGNTLVLAKGDVAVTQTGPATVVPGETATYRFTIANNGPSYSQNVSFSDPLPSGMTFVSLTQTGEMFTLNPPLVGGGGSVTGSVATFRTGALTTFTLVAQLDPSATGTSLTNMVSATAATTDPNTINNSASVTSAISPQADVAVTQTGPATVVPGTDVRYKFEITNNGPSDAQNVSFSDPLPADMPLEWISQDSGPAFELDNTSGSIATLPAGASASFTLVALLGSSTTDTSQTNTITTASGSTDLNAANNAASITSTISPEADLSVTVVSGPAAVGGNLTYILTVINNGPSDAQNVVLTQTLPAGISYSSMTQSTGPASSFGPDANGNVVAHFASLPVGTFAIYQVHAAVARDAPLGPAPSTVSVTSTTTDTNLSNNSITDTESPITLRADLGVTFVAFSRNVGEVIPGSEYAFFFDVVNNGPSDAKNVAWSSAVPSGLSLLGVGQDSGPAFSLNPPLGGTGTITGSISTLLSGQSAMFEIDYEPDGSLGQTVTSVIRVTSDTPDAISSNNTLTVTAPVFQPPPPADLAISLNSTLSPAGAYAGSYITYTFDVTNLGSTAADTANVTYVIPSYAPFDTITGSSGFPVLPGVPAGATGPIRFTLPAGLLPGHDAHVTFGENILPSTPNSSVLTATATLSGLPTTDNPSNNTATVNTTVQTLADLAVTQTGPASVAAGSVANYQVTITNNGFSDSQNVSFAETLPQGIDAQVAGIVQDSGPAFTLSASGGSIATLPTGASATFTISVNVGSDVTPGTVLTATAAATTLTADFNTSNNSAQTNTTVQAAQASIIAVPTGAFSSASPAATVSPIQGFGRTIHTTLAGFSGVVAQFVDPALTATTLHFHVAINWGDGGLSVGTVTYDKANGRWNVSGSHRYKKKGVYTITVIVQDSAGRQGTITSHAIVGPMLVTPLTKQLV